MRHSCTWVALAAAMVCGSPAFAITNWYVSATDSRASDTLNDGKSPSTPFKTLGRLMTLPKMGVGDKINLGCGSTWYETLALTSANSVGYLTIQSYAPPGTDCQSTPPVISGGARLVITNWQQVSNKIYYSAALTPSQVASIGSNNPTLIFDPGSNATFIKARYPNLPSDGSNNFAIATGTARTSSLSDGDNNWQSGQITVDAATATAIAGNDVLQADIHMRNELWHIQSGHVTGISGNLLAVAPLPESMTANDGFVLENKLWMLDAPKEWFYDKTTGTLYMASATGANTAPPATLELVVRNNALTISDLPYVTINGINVQSTINQGIDIRNSPYATVSNSIVRFAATGEPGGCGDNAGIFIGPTLDINNGCQPTANATGSSNATVSYNTLQYNGHMGLYVISDSALVTQNGLLSNGLAPRTRNSQPAMRVRMPGGTVSNNTVMNSGYMGLEFFNKLSNGIATTENVVSNVVTGFCARYADCGGIYTYNGNSDKTAYVTPPNTSTSPDQNTWRATVENNYVYGAKSDYQGSRNGPDAGPIAGIYLDAFTFNVLVRKNFINNVPTGVYMNGASFNTIFNNNVHAATNAGLLANDGDPYHLQGNWIIGNYFHAYNDFVMPAGAPTGTMPIYQAGVAQSWGQKDNPALLFSSGTGGLNNLVSGNVAVDAGGKTNQWRLRQSNPYQKSVDVSFGAWSQYTDHDMISTVFAPRLVKLSGTPTNLIYNGSFSSPSAPLPWSPWDISYTDQALSSVGNTTGCVGPCLFFNQTSGQALSSKPFLLNAGNLYYFEYLAMGQSGAEARPRIYRTGFIDNGFSPDQQESYLLDMNTGNTDARWTGRFFTAAQTDANATFSLEVIPNKPIHVDEVSLVSASNVNAAALYIPSQFTSFFVNQDDTATLSVSCPWMTGCAGAVDSMNNPLTFPLSLNPHSSKMVFLKPSVWAH
ncbi:MAG: right-handed parallel beta-helix repeat-containing protein [Aquabacterium sp.]